MIKQTLFALAVFALPLSAQAAVEIGKSAPDFTATDVYGEEVSLSDYEGKKVVLEWTNHQCPYVQKQYDSGNMQATQKEVTDNGAVWLTIVSSAEGKQGYTTDEEAIQIMEDENAHATTKIMDPSGEIGKKYDAKTTPHMFIINEEGNVVYAGAIDDNPSPRLESVEGAENYVLAAMNSLEAGEQVDPAQTAPYGCSVKY